MENSGNKILIVIALALGLGAGYYYGSKTAYTRGYEQARTDIKSRLEERRIVPVAPKEVKIIAGVIKSLGDNQFILESRLPYDPTLPDSGQNKSVVKTVLITGKTEISIRTAEANTAAPKVGEVFRPFLIKNTKIDFKSLKVADPVVVEAAENIADKSSFQATAVIKNQ